MLKPWKFPTNAFVPWKAMSEFANDRDPTDVGLKNPAGLSRCESSDRLLLASCASSQPGASVGRGSACADAPAGTPSATMTSAAATARLHLARARGRLGTSSPFNGAPLLVGNPSP
jgi:hypothetical protein